jgi:predicted DNA-binding transcriptional regulator AlpA
MNHRQLKITSATDAESGHQHHGLPHYSYAYAWTVSPASSGVPTPFKQGCEKQNANTKLGSGNAHQAGVQSAVSCNNRADQNENPHTQPVANRKSRRALRAAGIDVSGDGYLRLDVVLSVYPVSRAAWYEGMAAGIYPPSVSLGKRAVGWTRESIRQLIANPPKF